MSGPEDQALRARAARVIPNGMFGHQATHLLPPALPQFLTQGLGAHIQDAATTRATLEPRPIVRALTAAH